VIVSRELMKRTFYALIGVATDCNIRKLDGTSLRQFSICRRCLSHLLSTLSLASLPSSKYGVRRYEHMFSTSCRRRWNLYRPRSHRHHHHYDALSPMIRACRSWPVLRHWMCIS
jgi:hypothetical protein